jgi:hypothetical protein
MPVTGVSELRRLIVDLGMLPVDLRRELAPEFVRAAQPILADARGRAAWSTRIPAAMRVIASRSRKRPGVKFIVDAGAAPHARLYEFGPFRHPVHGHRDRWVAQAARPFILPAIRAGRQEFVAAADRAAEKAARRRGWR